MSYGRSGGGSGGPKSPLFRSIDKLVELTDGGAAPSLTQPAVKKEWGSGMGIRFIMRTKKDNWGGGSVGARMRLAQAAGLSEGRVVVNVGHKVNPLHAFPPSLILAIYLMFALSLSLSLSLSLCVC